MEWLFRFIDGITGKQAARQLEFDLICAQSRVHWKQLRIRFIWEMQDALGEERNFKVLSWTDQQLKAEMERILNIVEPRPAP